MATRKESVRLTLIDEFSTRAARIAAEARALSDAVDSTTESTRRSSRANNTAARSAARYTEQNTRLHSSLRSVSHDLDQSERGLSAFQRRARSTERQLDSVTGRVNLMGEALVTLGPALLPLGAVSVAGVAGLTTELGFAAAAAGTMVLAFHGVGDALEAVDAARTEPTIENLRALQESLADLGPQGRGLVSTIRGLADEWAGLQRAARAGLPGIDMALTDLTARAPDAERILRVVSRTVGDLATAGAADLTTGRWDDFFDFLRTDAEPTLTAMGQSAGNVVHALAELAVAGKPLNDGFSDWLVKATSRLDTWASHLSQTDGYRDFLDYVDKEGPQVATAVGDIADAIVQVAEAAGPLGGLSLRAIDSLAKLVSGLADSDIGGPLLAGTAGLLAFNRALTITNALGRATVFSRMAPQVSALGDTFDRAGASAGRFARTQRVLNSGAARGAAGVAAMALAGSDAGDSLLGATAAAAGLGFLVGGPWGAAIGGGAGLLIGLAEASDDAGNAQDRLKKSLQGTDFSQFQADLDKAIKAQQELGTYEHPRAGGTPAQMNPYNDVVAQGQSAMLALNQLAIGLGAKNQLGAYGDIMGQTEVSITDLQKAAAAAQPALEHFGITFDDLGKMDPSAVAETVRQITGYMVVTGQGAAASDLFGGSLRKLSLDAVRAAGSATALTQAIGAYAAPALDAEAATDAWHTSLTGLKKTLNDKAGFTGWSKAAVANRDATRGYAQSVQQMLTTQAANGASEQRIAKLLATSRREFIATGVAAGFSRKEMVKRANTIGLTPKLARTVFEAAGIDATARKVRTLQADLKSLPKRVQTDIAANGIPKTQADVEALQRKYKLTPEQVKTLMRLDGVAAAIGDAGRVQAAINHVTGKTVTITTIMRTVRQNAAVNSGNAPQNRADGGQVLGDGGPRDDKVPAWLSNREWVHPVAAVDFYGDRFMNDVQTRRFPRPAGYADGGPVKRVGTFSAATYAKGGAVRKADKALNLTPTMDLSEVKSELRAFEKAIRKAGIRLGDRFDTLSVKALDTAGSLQSARDRLEKYTQLQSEVRANAAGSFNNDIFGGDLAGLQLQLSADTNDANSVKNAISKAGGKGLSGGLEQGLSGSGNVALAQQIAGLSAAQIAQLEHQFDARSHAQNSLGSVAVAYSGIPQKLEDTTAAIKTMTKRMEHIEHHIEAGVRRGAREGLNDHDRNRNRRGATAKATGRRA